MLDTEERGSPKALKNFKINSKSIKSFWENVWNEMEGKSGRLKIKTGRKLQAMLAILIYILKQISNMVIFTIWKYNLAYNWEGKKLVQEKNLGDFKKNVFIAWTGLLEIEVNELDEYLRCVACMYYDTDMQKHLTISYTIYYLFLEHHSCLWHVCAYQYFF